MNASGKRIIYLPACVNLKMAKLRETNGPTKSSVPGFEPTDLQLSYNSHRLLISVWEQELAKT